MIFYIVTRHLVVYYVPHCVGVLKLKIFTNSIKYNTHGLLRLVKVLKTYFIYALFSETMQKTFHNSETYFVLLFPEHSLYVPENKQKKSREKDKLPKKLYDNDLINAEKEVSDENLFFGRTFSNKEKSVMHVM